MLHYETIDSTTLELLKSLMNVPVLKNMYLTGGTALALQIGHRKSIDLDLFGNLQIDEYELLAAIKSLGKTSVLKKSKNIFVFLVNNIKIDIVNYPYLWIDEPILKDNLRIAGKRDIVAMKLSAITGRGSKKDFIDLSFLLQEYNLGEMLSFYSKKYPDGSVFLVLKSLTYFKDADGEVLPQMLKTSKWQDVKEKIVNIVHEYLN